MTPPLNLVLINTKKSDDLSELHRRWIARVAPICKAYNLHLTLFNFKIDDSPIEFAKKIAPSTSIGKGGEGFIELAQKGKVQITNLPLPQNIGTMVVCTAKPEENKEKNIDMIIGNNFFFINISLRVKFYFNGIIFVYNFFIDNFIKFIKSLMLLKNIINIKKFIISFSIDKKIIYFFKINT